ncbi:sodium-coupled monocarboxylate transporter 2-like [Planococcus citri]|uniref:sodium-coupled monocarboxylate transporter 2-like n=1 Tax=Planococcus citri TaxID=170843 RepID=UPI0031FA0306
MSSLFVDYVVFGLLIVATLGFNVYNNFAGPKEKTKADYVFASGRSTSTWAMLLSISRGFLGVRVFLGYPSELFYRGSEMWEIMYGMCLAFPVVAYFFVPVYFSLGITSVYQYLDLRFNSRLVRCLASGTYVMRNLLNLGVTVFTPCVALKTVIGVPYWMSIVAMAMIGIVLTAMGGLRTAIMADVIQGLIMIACSIAVIIQGTFTAKDGPLSVITKPYERGRLNFFNFDFDPTIRVTTISALLGQFFISLSLYGCQQSFVQRYLSMKTQEKVVRTLWLNVPFMAMLMSLSWVVGMVVFAHYADCDPKRLGYISQIDEILPFYIEDKFTFLPGFLGLTMACLFNGGLSFFVSNLNSMATVVWEDFLSHTRAMKHLSDKNQLFVIKLTGGALGLCIAGVAFMVSYFSGVIESSMLMTSATSGPLVGVFVLAMFVPLANWKGAAIGMIASHAVTIWLIAGSMTLEKQPIHYMPTSTNDCANMSFMSHVSKFTPAPTTPAHLVPHSYPNEFVDDLVEPPTSGDSYLKIVLAENNDIFTTFYRITYMYYALIGCFITVTVGAIISYFTGSSDEHKYSESLLHPITRKLCKLLCCLPSCCTGESSPRPKRVPSMSEKLASQDFPSQVDTIDEKSSKMFCYTNDAFNADTDSRGQEVIS